MAKGQVLGRTVPYKSKATEKVGVLCMKLNDWPLGDPPEAAAAICDHDTPKLEALLQGGLNLNAPIQLSEYIKLMPLEIAVFRNDVPMIHFLLEHGRSTPT